MGKPILCLDFDGVCHSYTSKWQDIDIIPDPPVPGLFEFIEEAQQHFEIHIYSTRSAEDKGIEAMLSWFADHRKQWKEAGGVGGNLMLLKFPTEKPKAFITIDDRALTFIGEWPDISSLINFRPWNRQ